MLLDHTRVPAGLSCASRTIAKADNKVLYADTWLWAVLISDMATELGREDLPTTFYSFQVCGLWFQLLEWAVTGFFKDGWHFCLSFLHFFLISAQRYQLSSTIVVSVQVWEGHGRNSVFQAVFIFISPTEKVIYGQETFSQPYETVYGFKCFSHWNKPNILLKFFTERKQIAEWARTFL